MYGPSNMGALLVFMGFVCAFGGWALIELISWLFSFVTLTIG